MGAENRAVFRFDEFALETASGTLRDAGGAEIKLRPKGFALPLYLLETPGVLHPWEALLDALWPGLAVTDDSLTQCVGDLRRALGDRATVVLRTLPRRGYMLTTAVLRETAPGSPPVLAPAPPSPVSGASRRTATCWCSRHSSRHRAMPRRSASPASSARSC